MKRWYLLVALWVFAFSLGLPALSQAQDMDGDGWQEWEDCDDWDINNWWSCGACLDLDGDFWYTGCDAYVTISGPDCNDGAAAINPGAAETVGDGIDQNCDARDMCYLDNDNDNFGSSTTANGFSLSCSADANRSSVATDCNDANSSIYPGRPETIGDGVDQDCDAKDMCYADNDNDNYGVFTLANGLTLNCSADANRSPVNTDCNDANPGINPTAFDVAGDGVDQNCDYRDMCYLDNDNDNYGTSTQANGFTLSCSADVNRSPFSTDCNDANPAVYPTAAEAVGDGIDQDCDFKDMCYLDGDNDNYGVMTTIVGLTLNCSADANRAPVPTDCNDANPAVNPSATEVMCDLLDNDCSALTPDDADADNDLATLCFGDCNDNNPNVWLSCAACTDADTDSWYAGCDQYVTVSGPDCNDATSVVYPNAAEICDGLDNQCSGNPGYGTVDEGCTGDADLDGLTDETEGALGTDRLDPDTDHDGLNDGAEVAAGTQPLVPDTDGDSWLDGVEVQSGTNPLLASSYPRPAGPEQLVNYQGRLTDAAGLPANGPLTMSFSIYGVAAGGTPLWSESQVVTVSQGIYNVLLGSVTPLAPELFAGGPSDGYYLQVQAGAEILSPRQRLSFVPFAMFSSRLFDGRLEMDGRTLSITTPAAAKTLHVNFNQAFLAPPRVVVSPLDDEIAGVPFVAAKVRNITATGFDVTFRSLTGASAAGSAAFTYQAFGQ